MNLNEYQESARDTALYPGQGDFMGLAYSALGLAGEAGEVADEVKKTWRDDGHLTEERKVQIFSELGDTLWYLAEVATEIDVKLEDVAEYNLEKLRSRRERGVISGSGSNR